MNAVRSVWWLQPSKLVALLILPLYILIVFRLYNMDLTLSGQVPYKNILLYLCGGVSVFVFIIGLWLGERFKLQAISRTAKLKIDKGGIERILLIYGCVTVAAYLIWFGPIIINFSLVKAIITGAPGVNYIVRNNYGTVGGITTLTQFGVVFASIYIVFKPIVGNYSRIINIMFWVILLLTLFRVLAWSERLAFLEIMLPLVVGFISYGNSYRINRWAIFFAPLFGVIAIICFFIAFEYRRSWLAYYNEIYDSLFVFGLDRFLEYYILAINNGIGIMQELTWPTWEPITVFAFLFDFPIVGGLFSSLFGDIAEHKSNFLYLYADSEFNNISGIFLVVFELGWVGWLLTFLCGLAVGVVYSLARYSLFWRVSYCCIFIGVLEILRVTYYAEGRFFAVVVGLVVLYFLLRSKSHD